MEKKEPSLDAVHHDQLAAGDCQPLPGHVRGELIFQHPLPPGHLLLRAPGVVRKSEQSLLIKNWLKAYLCGEILRCLYTCCQ